MATATTVTEYLKALPDDRRKALQALRKVIKANLDPRFREGIQYGMVGYFLPHSVYPAGYHCDPKQPLPFLSLASQKNHMALYLFCIYTMPGAQERFAEAWRATGRKLDMGKSCVRFRQLDDVPLEVLGETIAAITADDFVRSYEAQLGAGTAKPKTGTAKPKAGTAKPKAGSGAAGRRKAPRKTPAGPGRP